MHSVRQDAQRTDSMVLRSSVTLARTQELLGESERLIMKSWELLSQTATARLRAPIVSR